MGVAGGKRQTLSWQENRLPQTRGPCTRHPATGQMPDTGLCTRHPASGQAPDMGLCTGHPAGEQAPIKRHGSLHQAPCNWIGPGNMGPRTRHPASGPGHPWRQSEQTRKSGRAHGKTLHFHSQLGACSTTQAFKSHSGIFHMSVPVNERCPFPIHSLCLSLEVPRHGVTRRPCPCNIQPETHGGFRGHGPLVVQTKNNLLTITKKWVPGASATGLSPGVSSPLP